MAGDWEPQAIEDLPEPARTIARQWPAGAYTSSAAGHRAHMIGSGRRAVDHDALWAARIVQLGAGPIRDGKVGLSFEAPAAATPSGTAFDLDAYRARLGRIGWRDDAIDAAIDRAGHGAASGGR